MRAYRYRKNGLHSMLPPPPRPLHPHKSVFTAPTPLPQTLPASLPCPKAGCQWRRWRRRLPPLGPHRPHWCCCHWHQGQPCWCRLWWSWYFPSTLCSIPTLLVSPVILLNLEWVYCWWLYLTCLPTIEIGSIHCF